MLYRSKEALLQYILCDGLIRKSFAKECPECTFVLDEVTNQVVDGCASRRRFRLVVFCQGRHRDKIREGLALLFHVFNGSGYSILTDHRDDIVSLLDLIRILRRLGHTETDFFASRVLYRVMPSLNVCQLTCDTLNVRIRDGRGF